MRAPFLAALVATSALTAGQALAVDVKLYGVVNKGLMMHDDGNTSEATVVDNNNESTRFGLAGEKKLDNGLTASVLFEVEQNSNPSNLITQAGTGTNNSNANTPASTNASFNERIARVGLAHDKFGAIFLGQQDLASDDAFVHDLGAATSVLNANFAAFGGGLVFQNAAGNATLGGSNLTPTLFALGNDGALVSGDAIRYNSPIIADFNGSLSIAQGGNVDATARYAKTFGDIAVDGAIGYTFVNSTTTSTGPVQDGNLLASVSAKHSSGFAGTLGYGSQSFKNKVAGAEDPTLYYAKASYAWNAYGVAVDYAKGKNPVAASGVDHEMDSFGLGAEYALGSGVTLGALYRNFSADVDGAASIDDINLGVLNMRVKF